MHNMFVSTSLVALCCLFGVALSCPIVVSDVSIPENILPGSQLQFSASSPQCSQSGHGCEWQWSFSTTGPQPPGCRDFSELASAAGSMSQSDLTLTVSNSASDVAAAFDFEQRQAGFLCHMNMHVQLTVRNASSSQVLSSCAATPSGELTNVDEPPIIQWLWTGNITENSPSTTHAVAGLRLVDTDGSDPSCGGWACAVDVSVISSPPGVLQLQAGNAGLVTSGVPVDYETHQSVAITVCVGGTMPVCDSRNVSVLNVDEPLEVRRTDGLSLHFPENQPWTSSMSLNVTDPDLEIMPGAGICDVKCIYAVLPGSVVPPEAAPWIHLTPQGRVHLNGRALNFETHPVISFTLEVLGQEDLVSSANFTYSIIVADRPDATTLKRPHEDMQQLYLSSTATTGAAVHYSELCGYDEDTGNVALEVVNVSSLVLWGGGGDPTLTLQAAPAQASPIFNTSTSCTDSRVSFSLQLLSSAVHPDPLPLGAYIVSLNAHSTAPDLDTPETRAEKQLLIEVLDTNDAHSISLTTELTGSCFDLQSPPGTLLATLEATDVDPAQQHEFTLPAELEEWFTLVHDCVPGILSASDMPPGSSKGCPTGQLQRAARIQINTQRYDVRALASNGITDLNFTIYSLDDGYVLASRDGGEHYTLPDGGTPTWRIRTNVSVPVCPPPPVVITSVQCGDCYMGLRAEGGNILRIQGTGLPPLGPTYPPFSRPELRAGVRNATFAGDKAYVRWGMLCRIIVSRIEVECVLPAAVNVHRFGVFLSYNGQLEVPVPGMESMQLAAPAIYDMHMTRQNNASADGGDEFTLFGSGFGAHDSFNVTLEGTHGGGGKVTQRQARDCERRENATIIVCKTPAGFGPSNQVVVTVGERSSRIPTISYKPPSIQSIAYTRPDSNSSHALNALPTNGSGALITLSATGFRLPSGAVVLDAVRSLEQQDANATAPPLLTISDLKCSVPGLDIVCHPPEGFGQRLFLQMQALGSISDTFPQPLVYAPPVITQLKVAGDAPPNILPSDEKKSTTLYGWNFGPSAADSLRFATVRHGGSRENITVPATGTHGRVVMNLPPGNGAGLKIHLMVDGIRSEEPHGVDYPAPVISGVHLVRGSLAEPPIVLRVDGHFFGSCCYWNVSGPLECLCSERGTAALDVQVGDMSCNITDVVSNGRLVCELQQPTSALLESASAITLTAAELSGDFVFSYQSLVGSMFIDSIAPVSAAVFSTEQGGDVRIEGRGFTSNQGFVEVFHHVRTNSTIPESGWVRLPQILQWSSGIIRVKLPPGQGDLLFRAGMDGSAASTTNNVLFSYPMPVVESVSQTPVPTSGHWSTHTREVAASTSFVTIIGKNFGQQAHLHLNLPVYLASGERATEGCYHSGLTNATCSVQAVPGANAVKLGTEQCAIRTWNDTMITCFAPDGVGSPVVSILVFRRLIPPQPWQVGSVDSTYRVLRSDNRAIYNGPQVQRVVLNSPRPYPAPVQGVSPAVGGGEIAVFGTSFGTPELLAAGELQMQILLGEESVTNVTSHDHSLLTFIAPAGTGTLQLVVQVGPLSSRPIPFVYDAPVFSTIRNFGDGEKARRLISLMADSGVHPHNRTVRFPSADSSSQVAVVAPGAPPQSASWTVPLEGTDVLSSILAIDSLGGEIQITGWNFATGAPSNASIVVGGVPCLPPTGFINAWTSDSTLVCVLPAMTIGRKSLRVHVLNREIFVPAAVSPIFVVCDTGFYATTAHVDSCQPCPTCSLEPCRSTGASCQGAWSPPAPTAGFWQLDLYHPLPLEWRHLQAQRAEYLTGASQHLQMLLGNNTGHEPLRPDRSLSGRLLQCSPATRFNISDVSLNRWLHVPCMPEEACDSDNNCAEGYTGISCRDCSPGFYRTNQLSAAGHCVSCGSRSVAVWILLTAVIVFAPMAYTVDALVRVAPSVQGLKTSLVLLQMFAVILRADVPWSGIATALLPMGQVSVLSLALLPPDCSLHNWSYMDVWYMYQSIPLAMLGSCLVWSALWCLFVGLREHTRTRSFCSLKLLRPWQVALRSWMTSLDLVYVGLLLSAVEPFTCVEVGGKQVLQADFAVDCSTQAVADLRIVAAVFLGLYAFALPLGQLAVLSLFRQRVLDNMIVMCEPYSPLEGLSSDKLLLLRAENGDFAHAPRSPAPQSSGHIPKRPSMASGAQHANPGCDTDTRSRSVSTGHILLHGFAGHLYQPFQRHATIWTPTFIAVRSVFVLLVSYQLSRPLSAGLTAGMLWGTLGIIMMLWAPHRAAQVPHSMAHAARCGALGAQVYQQQAAALNLPVKSPLRSLKVGTKTGKGDDLDETDSNSIVSRFNVAALYDSYVQDRDASSANAAPASAGPGAGAPAADKEPHAQRKRLMSVDLARPKTAKRRVFRKAALMSVAVSKMPSTATSSAAASDDIGNSDARARVLPSTFKGLQDKPSALSKVLHASLYGQNLQDPSALKSASAVSHPHGQLQARIRGWCCAAAFAQARCIAWSLLLVLDTNRTAAALCCFMLLSTQATLLNLLLEINLPAELIITCVQLSLIGVIALSELSFLLLNNTWKARAAKFYDMYNINSS